ncbi:GGDEF domain-containing protein [Embleya sp. MST-111070]|uniref:GGDEF domain-containing protein n=1 Tax=Embleya sp. MST-111070 TaxID=3398231 RepID=UPI003F73C5EE
MYPNLLAAVAIVSTTGSAAYVQVLRHRLRRTRAELDRVRVEARTCPLTGLFTRAAWTRAADVPSTRTLLLIDLDGFKSVNDAFGHAAGDAVLEEIARRLTAWIGSAGTAGRLGGDEFVVAASRDVSHELDMLNAALTAPIPWKNGVLRVGASIGVAHRKAGQPFSATLHEADAAMYSAKHPVYRGSSRTSTGPVAPPRERPARGRRRDSTAGPCQLSPEPVQSRDTR